MNDDRLRIAEALLVAIDHAAEVLEILSSAKSLGEAESALQARFGLDELQATAILDMQFRRVVGTERAFLTRIVSEHESERGEGDGTPRFLARGGDQAARERVRDAVHARLSCGSSTHSWVYVGSHIESEFLVLDWVSPEQFAVVLEFPLPSPVDVGYYVTLDASIVEYLLTTPIPRLTDGEVRRVTLDD